MIFFKINNTLVLHVLFSILGIFDWIYMSENSDESFWVDIGNYVAESLGIAGVIFGVLISFWGILNTYILAPLCICFLLIVIFRLLSIGLKKIMGINNE
ncbi:hypothetical protein N9O69_05285 [Alphaproteobacteria bacterium]|nr:hypothetical protein [Alphaproteobacteria bacterium]